MSRLLLSAAAALFFTAGCILGNAQSDKTRSTRQEVEVKELRDTINYWMKLAHEREDYLPRK